MCPFHWNTYPIFLYGDLNDIKQKRKHTTIIKHNNSRKTWIIKKSTAVFLYEIWKWFNSERWPVRYFNYSTQSPQHVTSPLTPHGNPILNWLYCIGVFVGNLNFFSFGNSHFCITNPYKCSSSPKHLQWRKECHCSSSQGKTSRCHSHLDKWWLLSSILLRFSIELKLYNLLLVVCIIDLNTFFNWHFLIDHFHISSDEQDFLSYASICPSIGKQHFIEGHQAKWWILFKWLSLMQSWSHGVLFFITIQYTCF